MTGYERMCMCTWAYELVCLCTRTYVLECASAFASCTQGYSRPRVVSRIINDGAEGEREGSQKTQQERQKRGRTRRQMSILILCPILLIIYHHYYHLKQAKDACWWLGERNVSKYQRCISSNYHHNPVNYEILIITSHSLVINNLLMRIKSNKNKE